MKLGVGSYTFTWAVGVPGHNPPEPMTALGLLKAASELGARVVQVCDNLPLVQLARPELDDFYEFARDHGMSIEIGTRGMGEEHLLAHLQLARRFSSPFVRLVVDSGSRQPSAEETVSLLRPLAARFADAGVKLAIENHDRFSAATLAGIIEALGPAHAGVCLDTVNSFGALEGPEVVVETLAPYALNLHVKDFTIERMDSQMGFLVKGCPAGQGRLNVPWLLEQLRSAGRDLNAILELWTPLGPTLKETIERERTWAQQSVAYLRRFIVE